MIILFPSILSAIMHVDLVDFFSGGQTFMEVPNACYLFTRLSSSCKLGTHIMNKRHQFDIVLFHSVINQKNVQLFSLAYRNLETLAKTSLIG